MALNGDNATLTKAHLYRDAGLSILPVALDGTKRPDMSRLPRVEEDGQTRPTWDPFKERLPSHEDVERWFHVGRPAGIGVIGGAVSGGLETFDFDIEAEVVFPAWCELVDAEVPGLVARLSVARTPKPGFHVRYRCPGVVIPGNDKLAQAPGVSATTGKPTKVTLIETRGEGGYAVAPGSPAEVHETGRLYIHHCGPELENVQAVSAEEREVLIRAARSFDRSPVPEEPRSQAPRGDVLSPGDDYKARGPDWLDIIGPHGWTVAHRRGEVLYVRRPDKEGRSWSATVNACRNNAGQGLLYVFSSNAAPFEQGKAYSKFAAFTFLNHRGDFKAAARALAEQGYGEQKPRRQHRDGGGDGATGRKRADKLEPKDAIHLTDLRNARRIVQRHGEDLRFIFPWKTWLVWDGQRWAEDKTGEAVRRVKETIGALTRETADRLKAARDTGDDEKIAIETAACRSLLESVRKWEDARAIARSLELARSEPGVPALPPQLDADPFLLNVLNGTIDLRTGQLRPHRRDDLITKLAPVKYDEAATCPTWLKFLDRIMSGNRDLITYLQRVCGYCLTGDVSEQSLWFFHGAGANGKSTFLTTILAMLGDYAMQAVSDLLMVKHNESHPTERADLFGRRFVATIETEEGKRMAEALMKQLTGGDKMRARKMRQDFFEFAQTWKIVMAANHKPVVRGTDHAAWRRIKLVPFTVTIPDAEKDKRMPEKLMAESPGILMWAVAGCLDWKRHGLAEPDEVRQATADYQAEQDVLAKFLTECCQFHPEVKTKASALYEAYQEFSGDRFLTQHAFGDRLRLKGYESKRGTGGSYFWHGIKLDLVVASEP